MDEFEADWARVSPWIKAALKYDPTHNIDDVKARIVARQARLWAGTACAVVTEIFTWPRMKTLQVWLAGGDLTELREVWKPVIEDFARAEGCSLVVITGRQGWGRALGYEPATYSCVKDLT